MLQETAWFRINLVYFDLKSSAIFNLVFWLELILSNYLQLNERSYCCRAGEYRQTFTTIRH